MQIKKASILSLLLFGYFSQAQIKPIILKDDIVRIETEFASDKMEERALFTRGIDLTSVFIENEFKNIELSNYKNLKNYCQGLLLKEKGQTMLLEYFLVSL